MVKILISAAVVTSALLVGWGVSQSSEEITELSVTPRPFEWGEVTACDPIDCLFELRNPNTYPVKILEVKKGCSCESVDVPAEIPPESTVSMRVHVDTTDISGDLIRSVVLQTDDPETPKLKVLAHGIVTPFCATVPPRLMAQSLPGESFEETFALHAASDLAISTVKLAESEEPLPFAVSIAMESDVHHVTLSGVMPEKRSYPKIPFEITTSDGVTRRRNVRTTLSPLPRVTCSPRHALVFDLTESGARESRTRFVELESSQPGVEFAVLEASCSNAESSPFRVEVETVRERTSYRISVELLSIPDQSWLKDRLSIVIDDGKRRTFEVSLVGRVPRQGSGTSAESREG